MKKYYVIWMLFLCCSSCEDRLQSDINGKWKLQDVQMDGLVSTVDTVWYNFQSKSLFSIQLYNTGKESYYEIKGFRKEMSEREMLMDLNCQEWELPFVGWPMFKRVFIIDELNRKRLILRSEEGYIYTFNKF